MMYNRLFAGMLGLLLAALFLSPALAAEEETASAEIEKASIDIETASTETEEASEELKVAITAANFVATSPEKENLDDEWVEISNLGSDDVVLAGWTLTDEQNHTYTFPDFVLVAGRKVVVRTGEGDDTLENLFWNRSTSIWNNGGDLAILRDPEGNIVSQYPQADEEEKEVV